ncbi:MAG TPA: cyclase, partial [Acidobacteriota bacterium]|nr:cyclase [Acidobacteriota bacterium]
SIAWRSVEGSDIDHAGTVLFRQTVEGFTEVKIVLNYAPPAGKVGEAFLEIFGKEPGTRLEQDLRRLKEMMEPATVAHS